MRTRKGIKIAADGGAWGWQRVFLQDGALLYRSGLTPQGMIVRRTSDGLQVPAVVDQWDDTGVDLLVLAPIPQRGVVESYRVEAGDDLTTPTTNFMSYGKREPAANRSIEDPNGYTVYDEQAESGNSIASNVKFVHPFVCKVPEGSWARNLDANLRGEVTHLIADTPYPGNNTDYENPVLFYSADNCKTRYPVPSPSIPWPIDGVPASGSNKDVCVFFLPESGDVVVSWKNPVDEAKFARISGTHLTDAAIDSEWSNASVNADVSSEFVLSNSYIALTDDRVRAFFTSPAPNDSDGCGSIYYRDTENFTDGASAVWTTETRIALAGGEYDRGWWHGGICHDGKGGPLSDGYYYLPYTEGKAGIVATFHDDKSHVRVFRSRSIDGPWEPSLDFLIEGGADLAVDGLYMCTINESDGGEQFAVYSMRGSDGFYTVGRHWVDLQARTVPKATAFNQGWGSSSGYDSDSPLLAAIDFQRGLLVDASPNSNDASLVGSPTHTIGDGVELNGTSQNIVIGSSDLLGGESYVDIGGLFTFPASLTGGTQGVLFDDNPGSGGSFEYGLRFLVDPATGQVTDLYWHNGSTAQGSASAVGPDLRGGTHFIRLIYDAANSAAKLVIDGIVYATTTVSGSLRSNAAKRVRIGCDGGGSNYLSLTAHYFYIRTGSGIDYSLFRPGYAYADAAIETSGQDSEDALAAAFKGLRWDASIVPSGRDIERILRAAGAIDVGFRALRHGETDESYEQENPASRTFMVDQKQYGST